MPSSKLRIETVVSQMFEENCYVAWLEGRNDCVVVDPGLDPDEVIAAIEGHSLTPAAILITHGHSDHIAGNAAIKEHWPACPIVIGHGDASKLTDPVGNLSAPFGFRLISPPADRTLREGDRYAAAGFEFDIFEIPGHSSGHIVFLWKSEQPAIVFGGDVLFAGSVGRTDFPDGSFATLAAGIKNKLFTLPDDTIVLSGHGPATTIGVERRTNPFVGEAAGR